ncbi:MAG: 50S ribosomal protein L7Ae [DPANN group archaeon]|nr:50S ribosomal protein L7Ae [DPANN group archaeon]
MQGKFDVPKELNDKVLALIQDARTSGKIRKGTNEATKSIERAEAKLVIIAGDVNPQEIIMHMPLLCSEKNIPYVFVSSKSELGAAAGLPVSTSAIAIVKSGDEKKLAQIVAELENITGQKAESKKMQVAKAAAESKE